MPAWIKRLFVAVIGCIAIDIALFPLVCLCYTDYLAIPYYLTLVIDVLRVLLCGALGLVLHRQKLKKAMEAGGDSRAEDREFFRRWMPCFVLLFIIWAYSAALNQPELSFGVSYDLYAMKHYDALPIEAWKLYLNTFLQESLLTSPPLLAYLACFYCYLRYGVLKTVDRSLPQPSTKTDP